MIFFKYHGAGNDFIILDNRNGEFSSMSSKLISRLCSRRFGIGSDGLILLSKAEGYDFKMEFFNPDGSGATFCGNGARCIIAFAFRLKFFEGKTRFLASDGEHEGEIIENKNGRDFLIRVKMQDADLPITINNLHTCYTGSPHAIEYVDELDNFDVANKGKAIRYSETFGATGTNVNFVKSLNDNAIQVRTYERGVEAETYSCGTGVTASGLVHAERHGIKGGRIEVATKGGNFSVYFKRQSDKFSDVWLEGNVSFVFKGEIIV